jgi:hypothetical protein
MKIRTTLIMIALIFAFTIIGVSLLIYSYKINVQECTGNPLVYGAKQYEKLTGFQVFGTLTIITPDNIKPVHIDFSAENSSVRE